VYDGRPGRAAWPTTRRFAARFAWDAFSRKGGWVMPATE
jgi:hypothetical protein